MAQSMSQGDNYWDNAPMKQLFRKLEDGVASGDGLYEPARSKTEYQQLPDGLLQPAATTSTQ
jgi:hypothetical protein